MVVKAVCATKLPTLTFQDVARFRGLIADIFPGACLQRSSSPDLNCHNLQPMTLMLPVWMQMEAACMHDHLHLL